MPWNWPFHNVINPLTAAVFSGNAIVIKVWGREGHCDHGGGRCVIGSGHCDHGGGQVRDREWPL